MTETNATPEVDTEYIVQTLIEENRALSENRLYLMALIKQIKAEYTAALNLWEAEKESLLASATAE